MQNLKRKRGVILTHEGLEKLQEAKLELEVKENSGNRYTIEDLSERAGLNPSTVGKILAREERVDKRTLELYFNAFNLELDKNYYSNSDPSKRQDWGEAMCVSVFYGRTEEIATLEQWIISERCQLVALLGMGGIGKTALSVKFAQQIQDKFEYVIWRSLRDAPPIETLLANLIQFLSDEQETETNLPERIGDRISRLLDYLRKHRCLLVLDNAEAILRSGSRVGQYQEGYEGYGELLKRVGEVTHKSCLLLTSREKPKEVALLEGDTLPVRSLRLSGLKEAEGQKIFAIKGLSGSQSDLKTLTERYAGNALALKVVATTILDLFDGNIAEFFQQDTVVFGDIRDLLDQQFERLSNLEKDIIYWLTINREPISLSELRSDLIAPIPQPKILEALESLGRRSLIEKNASLFTLQPVVMEYVTHRLIEQVAEEIVTQKLNLFSYHALLKAKAKDYVKDTQVRLILQPVINELIAVFKNKISVEEQLTKILDRRREASPLEPEYTGGNVLNLLGQLKKNLSGIDFSYLTVWQADLRGLNFHNVNFSHADLTKSVFNKTFGSISSVAFSPDGKFLATSDTNGEICLWREFADGEQLLSFKGHTSWVRTVAFSPDGRTLVSCSTDQTVKLWDVSTGECLQTLRGHSNRIWCVAFSPQGKILASSSDDQTIKLWDVDTGECLKTLQGHTGRIWCVTFSPDGQTLVSGCDHQTVKLWDVSSGKCLRTWRGYSNGIWSVAFSPDGQTIASGSENQTVSCWDVSTGKCYQTLQGHTHRVQAVALSPQGNILASGSDSQTVKLWDVNTGQCYKTLWQHTGSVRTVAFSPDGKNLATGSIDQTVCIWDVCTNQCLTILEHHHGVCSVTFSPQGNTLATGCEDETVKLWELNTGKVRQTFKGHTGWVCSVAFSPDGKTLASGGVDQTVRLWDVGTGRCLKTLQEHTSWVQSVAFSPDGQTLASGSIDQTVRLWDVGTGRCLETLQEHNSWVQSVAFSPDGKTLASGSIDETVKLWDAKTGDCLKTFSSEKPYEGMNITGATGLSQATIVSLKTLGAIEILAC